MSSFESRLCSLCETIDIVAAIRDLQAYETRTIPHRQSYASLLAAASSCRLCAVFRASLFREGQCDEQSSSRPSILIDHFRRTTINASPEFFRRSSTPKSFLTRVGSPELAVTRTESGPNIAEDVAGWHEMLDLSSDRAGFVIAITAESTLDTDFAVEYAIRYQRPMTSEGLVEGPKPRPLVLSNEVDLGLGISNRPIAGVPNFNIYSSWVTECASGDKHTRCGKAGPVSLPTRLIDVGIGAGSNIPRLVVTAGMRGQYVTLSHCWGKHKSLVTTSDNITSHQNGIPFNKFPRMFRDAMLITRIMGFRYIWVDTLCIIQNNVSDWEEECSRMGNIYRDSVCTLAAPSAPDSESGLLAQRSASGLPSCKLLAHHLGSTLGHVTIGPPPSELKEHASILSSRAWVLQEQVLSPRTLYFGRNGMYFQCNSHEQLESYHHALPPERVTSWRTSQASDLPKPLIVMASEDPVYWYFLVRQYSFRRLTYGSDKLLAISGLANHVAGEQEEDDDICELGEYWAGLWSRDLGRGLMWTSQTSWDPANTLHAIDESIPSWSWASQNTPVDWKVLREFRPDFECVAGIVERTSEHQFGSISSGRLELNAPIKSASLQRQSLPGKRISLCGIADARELAELCLDNTSATLFRAMWPDNETSFSCRLLMLGEGEGTLNGQRWYALALVPRGHGRYSRIGVANSLGFGATHARSLTLKQSWNWFGNATAENVVIV